MNRLNGKVAFITGAARGQGRAEAVRLAAEGADIIALDVCAEMPTIDGYASTTREDLTETGRLVEKQDRRVVTVQGDVRDLETVRRAVEEGIRELGRLDIVVANAGVMNGGRMWELTEDQWKTVIDVNLTGVWHIIKATVPTLISQGDGGSIILTSSVGGAKGLPFLGAYNAAKHGVVGLGKTLANELGEHEIRVNTILPTGTDTPMGYSTSNADLVEQHAETLGPMFMHTLPHSMIEAEDAAAAVAWLASGDARFVTGAQIPIDLGRLNR